MNGKSMMQDCYSCDANITAMFKSNLYYSQNQVNACLRITRKRNRDLE